MQTNRIEHQSSSRLASDHKRGGEFLPPSCALAFYFGDTNNEVDLVFFLNGLPIVFVLMVQGQGLLLVDGEACGEMVFNTSIGTGLTMIAR
jgi:hypothetical protein